MVKAIISNYRRGRHTAHDNQAILEVDGVDSKAKASTLVGRKVAWKTPTGKSISGVISAPHGAKGAVRARFTKGLPGQCIGTSAVISEAKAAKK